MREDCSVARRLQQEGGAEGGCSVDGGFSPVTVQREH